MRSTFLKPTPQASPFWASCLRSEGVLEADRLNIAVYDHVPELRQAAEKIAAKIEEIIPKEQPK